MSVFKCSCKSPYASRVSACEKCDPDILFLEEGEYDPDATVDYADEHPDEDFILSPIESDWDGEDSQSINMSEVEQLLAETDLLIEDIQYEAMVKAGQGWQPVIVTDNYLWGVVTGLAIGGLIGLAVILLT